MHHVNTAPEPPSSRLGKFVSTEFEALLMRCLAKHRDDRPATAHDLSVVLAACATARDWTESRGDELVGCERTRRVAGRSDRRLGFDEMPGGRNGDLGMGPALRNAMG